MINKMSVTLLGILFLVTPVLAETPHHTNLHGLIFDTKLAFSAPQKTGLDALSTNYPNNATPGKEILEITAVHFSPETLGEMGMNDTELLEYGKITFWGASKKGEACKRTLLGKSQIGERIKKSIPTPSLLEVYLLTRKDGAKTIFGFSYSIADEKSALPLINDVSTSLREE